MEGRFENRNHAGKLLAERLLKYQVLDPIILALPRGGVPIAHEISQKLLAPIDVVLVKKIGAPGHEEFAIGAVAEDEIPILNQQVIEQYKFKSEDIENIIVQRIKEIRNRAKEYRQKHSAISLEKRNVIVVDDGLATGSTMLTAIHWLRTQGVKQIIVAVPIASKEAAAEVEKVSDIFLSLLTPDEFWAVGRWYNEFLQVSDEEVIQLLQKQASAQPTSRDVWIEDGMSILQGHLNVPANSHGLILFAHGSGSSHKSPRNIFVSKALHDAGFGTLLFDLLTFNESLDRKNVFDIELMTRRLLVATEWIKKIYPTLPIAYFGASTGAAAALGAASDRLDIFAVVSRGGRPDLALESLPKVYAPTLLIVGEDDEPVIPLNQTAKGKLKNCQMVLIPRAGHLFEEPGALESVVEYAVNWFSHSLSLHFDHDAPIKEKIISEIEDHSIAFSNVSELDSWLESISHNKIIMLGESTHGTKEFYSIRREISKILIEKYGYSFIAIEGDWPDCHKINDYLKSVEEVDAKEVLQKLFHRWPTWMWANEEIPPLIKWMKDKKLGEIYGLDVYSLFESLEEIKRNLASVDPVIGKNFLEAYKCFEVYNCDEIAYAKSLLKWPQGCHEEVLNNLRSLLRLRLSETQFSKDELFDAKQNARIINNAEKYYRAMMSGGAESWNVRDVHMMDTLENILNNKGQNAKAIVWAHNTHIGDYHATNMLDNGHINLGGLARERFGVENVFLLGFSTYQGEVTAGEAWGGEEKKMTLPKANSGTYEDYFHQASINMKSSQFLTTFDKLDKHSSLHRKLGHRAVGVVYDPYHESRSHYVPTQMAKRYDGLLFIDRTMAITPLSSTFSMNEFPETWPAGQ
jgi:erythromycin esterase-like protein/predicted phosphoribosyltransferase